MLDFESWDLWDEFCNIITQSERIAEKKKKLKKMHDNGEPKPSQKIKIGVTLASYTSYSSSSFDLTFREYLSKWFDVDLVAERKKEFKRMHDNGEPKPHWKSKEGQLLGRYITRGKYFDQKFRADVPNWIVHFEKWGNNIDRNKKELKRMHDNGEPRPHRKSKEGKIIKRYVLPSGLDYDPKLKEELSNWFDVDVVIANDKKELKRLYSNGESRPHWKSKEAKKLVRYTSPSSRHYDSKLRKELSNWFDVVDERKKEFKRMHDNGEPKPHRKSKEGSRLTGYTNFSTKSFDPKFRKSLPKWFPKIFSLAEKKEKLKKMHDNGKPKPHFKSKEGIFLYRHAYKNGKKFDPEFRASIPDWFK